MNFVFLIGYVVVVFKVFGDVFKVFIVVSSGVLSVLSFEDVFFVVGKFVSKDELGIEFSLSCIVG